jgi:hypothetical protein
MTSIVVIFGLISGLISALMIVLTTPFMERMGFDVAEILGYTTLVASFLLVFFGIRRYREQAGGTMTFTRGFTVGILITLISSCIYVATWLTVSPRMAPDFAQQYKAHLLQKERSAGATDAEIEATLAQMRYYENIYANPLGRVAITFLEPFPIGLLVTVISAAVLRRKPPAASASAGSAFQSAAERLTAGH